MKNVIMVGADVMVRLALLPGMPDEDPTAEQIAKVRADLNDPLAADEMLKAVRESRDNPKLSQEQLREELSLYPRRRPAKITYVDMVQGEPAWVNLNVFTPGSMIQQAAVGHIPMWATQEFRLSQVPIYDEEPEGEGSDEMHVAYFADEEEET